MTDTINMCSCALCSEPFALSDMPNHDCHTTSENLPQSWQQVTPTKSDSEASFSLGISNLEAARKHIHALRLTVAGICSNLLTNSQMSIGAEVMEDLATVDASFVRLRNDMDALLHTVTDVHLSLTASQQQEPRE